MINEIKYFFSLCICFQTPLFVPIYIHNTCRWGKRQMVQKAITKLIFFFSPSISFSQLFLQVKNNPWYFSSFILTWLDFILISCYRIWGSACLITLPPFPLFPYFFINYFSSLSCLFKICKILTCLFLLLLTLDRL